MWHVPGGRGGALFMKIGFSSLACPGWDLETIVTSASEMGFDGVELRGLRGELHLPLVPELAGDPRATAAVFRQHGVELVCLASSVTLDSRRREEVARQKGILTEFVELAAKLECRFVRLFAGEVQRLDNHRAALARIAEALRSVAPIASRCGVTLLLENGGDFATSEDIWFLIDAADSPAVRCCWNQCNAKVHLERPTNSIPRLAGKLGMVHVCDATFESAGVLSEYKPPGEGDTEIARQIELLRGVAYDRYLVFEWPAMWVESLSAPEVVLPEVAKYLRERVDHRQPVLTAYKGDKYAPKLATRVSSSGAE